MHNINRHSPPSTPTPDQDHLWDDDTEDDIPDFDAEDSFDSVMSEELIIE